MESHYVSIMRRLLTLTTMIFLAVTLTGCFDPSVAEMEANHRQLMNTAEQELSQAQGLHSFLPTSQAEVFHPAP